MTKLKNKYVIGTHVMFYEVEMYKEFIEGIINMCDYIQNKQNILIDFCFNMSEHFEKIDKNKISEEDIKAIFINGVERLKKKAKLQNIKWHFKENKDDVYNIADYRRELNYNYCKTVDFIMWGETDSFFPRESFKVLETVKSAADEQNIHRYILSWAERKMWDESWKVTEHVDYENMEFKDTPDQVDNINYAKSPMPIEKMNEINAGVEELDIRHINYPKIDGSCLVISSELIKSGINIPHSLLLYGEDSSLGTIAKQILGDRFIQFTVKNILKVHARRHPKKRMYILNENNPRGFCGDKKGEWSKVLDHHSKFNLSNLIGSQNKFFTFKDVFAKLNSK